MQTFQDLYSRAKNLSNDELPYLDRSANDPSNQKYDAQGNLLTPYASSGFSGGEHRMFVANYNFIDPGAYAEDFNGDFDIRDGRYPDLDGDGAGETHGYEILPVDNYDIIAYDKTFFANSVKGP